MGWGCAADRPSPITRQSLDSCMAAWLGQIRGKRERNQLPTTSDNMVQSIVHNPFRPKRPITVAINFFLVSGKYAELLMCMSE